MAPSRIDNSARYACYLPTTKWFRKLGLRSKVTFFVGENGSGKPAMLEAIAVAKGLNAEDGRGTMTFAIRESHAELHKSLKLRHYHALLSHA